MNKKSHHKLEIQMKNYHRWTTCGVKMKLASFVNSFMGISCHKNSLIGITKKEINLHASLSCIINAEAA